MKNWSQSDEYTFFRRFFEKCGAKERARRIFTEKLIPEELYLRRFLRNIFLDVVSSDSVSYRFRLSAIINIIWYIFNFSLIIYLWPSPSTQVATTLTIP